MNDRLRRKVGKELSEHSRLVGIIDINNNYEQYNKFYNTIRRFPPARLACQSPPTNGGVL